MTAQMAHPCGTVGVFGMGASMEYAPMVLPFPAGLTFSVSRLGVGVLCNEADNRLTIKIKWCAELPMEG